MNLSRFIYLLLVLLYDFCVIPATATAYIFPLVAFQCEEKMNEHAIWEASHAIITVINDYLQIFISLFFFWFSPFSFGNFVWSLCDLTSFNIFPPNFQFLIPNVTNLSPDRGTCIGKSLLTTLWCLYNCMFSFHLYVQ